MQDRRQHLLPSGKKPTGIQSHPSTVHLPTQKSGGTGRACLGCATNSSFDEVGFYFQDNFSSENSTTVTAFGRNILLPPPAGLPGRKGCFDVSRVLFNTTAPLPSLLGRKPSCIAVRYHSSCKTFRSGWRSQPGRPDARACCQITKRSLMPGKLARGGSKTTKPGNSQMSPKKILSRLLSVANPKSCLPNRTSRLAATITTKEVLVRHRTHNLSVHDVIKMSRDSRWNIAWVCFAANVLPGETPQEDLLCLQLLKHFDNPTCRHDKRPRHIVFHKPSPQQSDPGQFAIFEQRRPFRQSLIDLDEACEFVAELVCCEGE